MRFPMILFAILLFGCQSVSPLDRWLTQPAASVMPLWATYQRCMATTDAELLIDSVQRLDHATFERAEPPEWLKAWGSPVAAQPLRTSVDPPALGIACTRRAAGVMAEREGFSGTRTLYQRVLTRYPGRAWVYYHEQARGSLVALPQTDPAVVALRISVPSPGRQ